MLVDPEGKQVEETAKDSAAKSGDDQRGSSPVRTNVDSDVVHDGLKKVGSTTAEKLKRNQEAVDDAAKKEKKWKRLASELSSKEKKKEERKRSKKHELVAEADVVNPCTAISEEGEIRRSPTKDAPNAGLEKNADQGGLVPVLVVNPPLGDGEDLSEFFNSSEEGSLDDPTIRSESFSLSEEQRANAAAKAQEKAEQERMQRIEAEKIALAGEEGPSNSAANQSALEKAALSRVEAVDAIQSGKASAAS